MLKWEEAEDRKRRVRYAKTEWEKELARRQSSKWGNKNQRGRINKSKGKFMAEKRAKNKSHKRKG